MTKEKIEKENEEENEEGYSIVELPVETGFFIRNNATKQAMNDKAVLAEILNKLDNIEKAVA